MKKPSAVVVFLLFLAQILLPPPTRACSIATSIFSDIVEADAIVLARIDRLEIHELGPASAKVIWSTPRRRTVATLRVLEAWKGNPPSTLDIDLGENYGSTNWKIGETFAVFLERGSEAAARVKEAQLSNYEMMADLLEGHPEIALEDSGFPQSREELDTMRRQAELAADAYEQWMGNRWSQVRVMGLESYPEEADRETLRELVRLAAELPARGDVSTARLDWHVRAAERRATRREGLNDLFYLIGITTEPMEVYVSEEDSDTDDEEISWENEPTTFEEEAETPAKLTRDQLRRLADGFAREPAVDQSDVTMLRLLADYPDLEVDRSAASVVEAGLLLRPIPRWVTEMVEETLKRYGDDFGGRIGRDDVDPRGRPIYTGEGENTLPTIWEVARRELGIPAVLPAEPPRRPRDETGRESWE
jgi:hypothetical protein